MKYIQTGKSFLKAIYMVAFTIFQNVSLFLADLRKM